MKKLIAFVIISLIVGSAFGQHRGSPIKWLSLSLKGGYGGCVFLNQDVLKDDSVNVNYFSPHYSFGGRFGITYGDNVGINIEPLWSGFNQSYSLAANGLSYNKTQKFTSFDLFISLRYVTDFGFYLEVGPQFSTLKSAKVENDKPGTFTTYADDVYMENFTKKNTSIGFGLGFAAINADRLQLFVGLRGNYWLGNFVDNPDYYVLNDGVYTPAYTAEAKTSPITYKLMLELNYFFAFWGDASCGRGRIMFFQ